MAHESTQYRGVHPRLTRPQDFEIFWHQTLDQLTQHDSNVQQLQQETRPDGIDLQWLNFRSLGGTFIRAYCLSWNDG